MTSLSIYVLTYNTPQQFEVWCERFCQAYPAVFKEAKKIVINNSDDCSLMSAYESVCGRFGFCELKCSYNSGICGGRFKAAEHFSQSDQKYMVFFEDDMLMNDQRQVCESGYVTFHSRLFELAVGILETEKLDYLKLSYTEVYNTNNISWAYQISTHEEKKQYKRFFKKQANLYTPIKHINSIDGLAYAVGAFYYCNWPLLFSQAGNQKFFMDNLSEAGMEMAWAKYSYVLGMGGVIRTGCLLASPITHNRTEFYASEHRIESHALLNASQ